MSNSECGLPRSPAFPLHLLSKFDFHLLNGQACPTIFPRPTNRARSKRVGPNTGSDEKLFHAEIPETIPPEQNVFTSLLPPPNVTGRLHMGHMLNHTEMDIIVRWHRMRGFPTMWLPGTDHAGIATQMMVERQLAPEGKNRRGMGREAFIERVWQWKQHYGGSIVEQMRRIGDSVDWGREYFTMDDNLSRAVREAFVRLYEEGLIYRGNYIVNWCPRCATAISDLEVVHEETHGKLYELKYPVVGSSGFHRRLDHPPGNHAGRHGGRRQRQRRALPASARPRSCCR